MKKIFLLLFIAIILLACASNTQVAEPTPTIVPTQTYTPTTEPTTTPDQVIESLRNKFYQAGLDFDSMGNVGNVEYKDSTWSIQSPKGEVFSISNVDLEKRVTITKNGNLQILDKTGGKVELAYDPKTNEFIFRADFINEDFRYLSKYPVVESFDDLEDFFMKEGLFLPDPPSNGQRTKPGTISLDSMDYHPNGIKSEDIYYPFGKPEEGEVSVVHTGNFFLLPKNLEEGRPEDMLVATTFVLNADGTWGRIHLIPPVGSDSREQKLGNNTYTTIELLDQRLGDGKFLMPRFKELGLSGTESNRQGFVAFLERNKISFPKGNEVIIDLYEEHIRAWVETGIVSPEMGKLIFPSIPRQFLTEN